MRMSNLGNEKKFWCVGMKKIREVLTSDISENSDVLAVLEFEYFDIELTDRGFSDGERHYDYFCLMILTKFSKIVSFDSVDFGDKKPFEFATDDELKADMQAQLEKFLEKYNM